MAAQLNSSLMTVSVISLLVPAAFVSTSTNRKSQVVHVSAQHEFLGDRLAGEEGPLLLQLSRGSSVVLILMSVASSLLFWTSLTCISVLATLHM